MPAAKRRQSLSSTSFADASKGAVITPHDVNELAYVTRAIYVGVAGDVKVVMADDVLAGAVVLKAMPVGKHNIAVRQVMATGTTATNLVALW